MLSNFYTLWMRKTEVKRKAVTGLAIPRESESELGLALQPSASSPVMVPLLNYCLCRWKEKYTFSI